MNDWPELNPEVAKQIRDDIATYACAFIDAEGNRLDPVVTERDGNTVMQRKRRYDEAAFSIDYTWDIP